MFGRSMPRLIVCLCRVMMSQLTKRGGMSMPRKLPPFVERWRDRHGKVRVYFRKDKGRRVVLPECQPHGLRKAAGRRLAEAGCTAHEIMAVLGHTTLTEA